MTEPKVHFGFAMVTVIVKVNIHYTKKGVPESQAQLTGQVVRFTNCASELVVHPQLEPRQASYWYHVSVQKR